MRERFTAELVGTAFLVMAVVGSGVMATRLTDDVGLQLLANSLATGAALVAVIVAWNGAYNPVVTWALRGSPLLVAAQVLGGVLGAVLANLMFELGAVSVAATERSSGGLWLAEVVATFGLVTVVLRSRPEHVAYAVAAYITAAYWFTASTSFANPAVTVARMLSDTFTGIAPASVPMFLLAQLVGAGLAIGLARAVPAEELA